MPADRIPSDALPVRAPVRPSEGGEAEAARWPTILLIVGAGVVSAFQVGKAPAALAAVQADLGLGLAIASWLLSAFAIVGALLSIGIGIVVDHLGARRMAVLGLLLQAACSALGAYATGASLLLATRLIEGVGFLAVAVAAPVLIIAVTRPQDRDRAFAVWATFMPVGIALVMLGAPLLGALGWRGFWLLNAAILLGYAGLLALGAEPVAPGEAARRTFAADVRLTLVARGPWILAGLFAAFSAMYFAVFGFLPSILADRLAVGAETGSVLAAIAVAASAVGCILCGQALAHGAPPRRILLLSFAAMAVCAFGIFSGVLPGGATYALCIAFSFIGGFIPVVLIDRVPRLAPRPDLIGATMGFLMQGNNAGLVIGPAATGAIAAATGWPAVSLLAAALALVAGYLATRLPRKDQDA